jgi:hypothetical protein
MRNRFLVGLLFLLAPVLAGAQFDFTTNNGTITITKYNGTNDVVTVPSTTNGYPVTSVGYIAFDCDCNRSYPTSVIIPDSVTNIGIGAFNGCYDLTNISLGNSIISIGADAFTECFSLRSVTFPSTLTSIQDYAFAQCTNLQAIYFLGNAPSLGTGVFSEDPAKVYYAPGTTGWTNFGGLGPAAVWYLPAEVSDAGVQNNQFGFYINVLGSLTVIVQTATNLADPVWTPLSTDILASGSSYFSDPLWTNYPDRFYRLSSP